LVEAFRDASGAPKQRTVATLGRLDQLSSGLESVISGLLRVTGRSLPADAHPAVEFESARDYGDVWALSELWSALGFDRLRPVFRRTRHSIDVEALARAFGWGARCIDRPDELEDGLAECMAHNGPFFLDVRIAAQENCFPMMPAGRGHHEIMLAADRWYGETET
jgi:hypothetical protein